MPRKGEFVPIEDRFWPKVAIAGPDECWLWTAAKYTTGYGAIGKGPAGPGHFMAHRVAYELVKGPIPEGLTIDHLCGVRACVNPAHLEAVTMQENLLRSNGVSGRNARKTRCPRGHPYDAVSANGSRRCRTCEADCARRARERRKSA